MASDLTSRVEGLFENNESEIQSELFIGTNPSPFTNWKDISLQSEIMQSKAQLDSKPILENDEIRVLIYDIRQSQSSGYLVCQTQTIKLAHTNTQVAPPYTALSYVWGDPSVTQPLICDSVMKQVTLSLLEALSIIWTAHPQIQLWADALSIDQENVTERNHQVSLMGDIFRSANHVFVSLGPALKGCNQFWDFLQSFVRDGDFDSDEFEDQLDGFMEGQNNNLAMGFDDLIQRPWFRRAWTYQEIRLATAAVVICGDSFMSWKDFISSLDAFDKQGTFLSRFAALHTFLKEQAFMFKVPSAFEASKPHQEHTTEHPPSVYKKPLLDILIDGWPRDASDARDKIYAFTSSHLASTCYTELKPDYALDIESTFIRFIRTYINNENSLQFLCFARGIAEPLPLATTGIPRNERRVILPNLDRIPLVEDTQEYQKNASTKLSSAEDLPSWICDWRVQGLLPKAEVPPWLINEHYFDVRANASPPRQSIHDFSKLLVFKGCALGRVGYSASKDPITSKDMLLLGTFTKLPRCALQKALDQESAGIAIPKQSQMFSPDITSGSESLPSSNLAILLLQTLLHDQTKCGCAEPPDPGMLGARCPYSIYPRSYACNLDWLFLLDGLAEPVLLRPHIIPDTTDASRDEVGFDFVSVCPLVLAEERERWMEAHFAYGKGVLY